MEWETIDLEIAQEEYENEMISRDEYEEEMERREREFESDMSSWDWHRDFENWAQSLDKRAN